MSIRDDIAIVLYDLVQHEIDEKLVPFDEVKHLFYPWVDHIIYITAYSTENMNVGKLPVGLSGTRYDSYIKGTKDEHNYIVEYLRGLLDS